GLYGKWGVGFAAGVAARGREAPTPSGGGPPLSSRERKFVPVAQLNTRRTMMPPRPIGTPTRLPPPELPRSSSMLLRSPGVQRMTDYEYQTGCHPHFRV